MNEIIQINEDSKSNSSHEISKIALLALKEYLEKSKTTKKAFLIEEFRSLAKTLIKSYKNNVLIQKKTSSIVYYLKRLEKSGKSIDDIKFLTIEKINNYLEEAAKKQKEIGILGARTIFNQNKILTISSSSNLKKIFISAKKINRKFEVYCLESRPLLEGQEFAQDLAKTGIQTYLLPDAMMGKIMPEMNLVLCGADRLYETGFVNKIGTFPLAVTAKLYNIPLFIVCETDKILNEIERTIRFYPENPEEVFNKKKRRISVLNYYYEEIPYEYVSKVICEEGVFETQEFIKWYIKD